MLRLLSGHREVNFNVEAKWCLKRQNSCFPNVASQLFLRPLGLVWQSQPPILWSLILLRGVRNRCVCACMERERWVRGRWDHLSGLYSYDCDRKGHPEKFDLFSNCTCTTRFSLIQDDDVLPIPHMMELKAHNVVFAINRWLFVHIHV